MGKRLLADLIEEILSQFPENVVNHFANAQREFLRGVQECVHACIDRTLSELDARVAGAQAKRNARQERRESRVTVEEEETA